MHGSNFRHQPSADQPTITPATSGAANGQAASPETRSGQPDTAANAPDGGEMTNEILITSGHDANEDETSEGWADRGGI